MTLTVTGQTTKSLTVQWTKPDNIVPWTFKLKYKLSGDSTYTDVTLDNPSNPVSHELTNLATAGGEYDIQVITTSYGSDGSPATITAHTSKFCFPFPPIDLFSQLQQVYGCSPSIFFHLNLLHEKKFLTICIICIVPVLCRHVHIN